MWRKASGAVSQIGSGDRCTKAAARVTVALAELRNSLPRYADIPFAGLTFTMQHLADSFQQQSGRSFRIVKFPWWLLGLAAPFWELARELREMRYLYELPHRLDGATLQAVLPQFQTTGLAEVAATQLRWAGLGRKIDPERVMA